MAAKEVVPVNVSHAINGYNLTDLPVLGHGHAAVGLRDIGLPDYELNIRVLLTETAEGRHKGRDAIEDSSLDRFGAHYGVGGEWASAEVVDEPEFVRVRFGNDVDRHRVHPRKEVRAKGGRVVLLG